MATPALPTAEQPLRGRRFARPAPGARTARPAAAARRDESAYVKQFLGALRRGAGAGSRMPGERRVEAARAALLRQGAARPA